MIDAETSADASTVDGRCAEIAIRTALGEVAAERMRQIEIEGWTPAHDDTHTFGELAKAAACYAWFSTFSSDARAQMVLTPKYGFINLLWWMWPKSWSVHWWKPKDRRRDLIRAAALIVAEIERLDRVAAQQAGG